MSSDQTWRIHIEKMETRTCIGIYDKEKVAQRLHVDAVIDGVYSAYPQKIEDCFNYDHMYDLVVHQWPKQPHVDLLETRVTELLQFVFQLDARVTSVKIRISKPDIFPEIASVGVEAQWSRADFERLGRK